MIVGLSGKAGAGKDTIADYLVKLHGFEKLSFAQPLKDMLAVLGVDVTNREHKEDPDFGLCGRSPRFLMQTLGTEWGRDIVHKNLWIHLLENNIRPGRRYVVSDVRFEDEAAWLRRVGRLWHVRRELISPPLGASAQHVSENGIIPITGEPIINNNASFDALFEVVRHYVQKAGE